MKQRVTEEEKECFRSALEKVFREPVALTITDNAHVFFNLHFKKKRWMVRLHWMFLKAENVSEIAQHIARYTLYRSKKSSKVIDQYIEDHWHWVRHKMPPIQTQGKYYNLQAILDDLNRRYLEGRIDCKITWSRPSLQRFKSQLQMGNYSTSKNLITIRPRLDQKFVPKYVVEATVFHEMCHALIPVRKVNGRRRIHPPEFAVMEKRYAHLEKAHRWEDHNFSRLLGKPLESERQRVRKRLKK